jgi:hypothetical protein
MAIEFGKIAFDAIPFRLGINDQTRLMQVFAYPQAFMQYRLELLAQLRREL